MRSATQQTNIESCACSSVTEAVLSLRQGNSEGFNIVYREYSKLVRAVCLKILRNPTEAEDVAQEVFIHMLRKIHTFRGDSAFSTWLYRVALNTVLMHVRSTRRDRIASIESRRTGNGQQRDGGVQNASMPSFSNKIDLRSAVDSLPNGYKLIFILHDIQGYHHHEISRILGRSIGDSKSQLHRARQRLREFLRDTSDKKRCRRIGGRELIAAPATDQRLYPIE